LVQGSKNQALFNAQLLEKDRKGRQMCDFISIYDMVEMCQFPIMEKFADSVCSGPFDHQFFLRNGKCFEAVTGKHVDFSLKRIEKAHVFQFQVWKKNSKVKQLIEAIFILAFCILTIYFGIV
jgi:hypothetical protein